MITELSTYDIKKGNDIDTELMNSTNYYYISCIHWESNLFNSSYLPQAVDGAEETFSRGLVPCYIEDYCKDMYFTIADAIKLVNLRLSDENVPFKVIKLEERPQYANSTVVFRIQNTTPMTYADFIKNYNICMGDFYEDQVDITIEQII